MRLADLKSARLTIGGTERQDSWESKHRPNSLAEAALNKSLRRDLEGYVEDGDLPHLILHGPAGRGKTTTALILANELDRTYQKRNASLRGNKADIAELDSKLGTMVGSRGTIMHFEEADGLSSGNRSGVDVQTGAQEALKDVMEKWESRVTFVFTTNHPDKLIAPIRSRCASYDFSQIPSKERARRLREIARVEELETEEGAIEALARREPDMRKALQKMQRAHRHHRRLTKLPAVESTLSNAFFTLRDALVRTEDWDGYPYLWEPYAAKGFLTLLAGPPKLAGKSTLARHLAAACTAGTEFLGQQVGPGRVLWVGPDEHWVHTALDLEQLEVPDDRLILWGQAQDRGVTSVPGVEEIADQAQRAGVDLIVMDTLPRVAGDIPENDNSAWTRWSTKALPHIRESDAAWLAIHHTRKGDDSRAVGIRGASQILGMVDVAITLSQAGGNRRRLEIVGSRLGLPPVQIIALEDNGYLQVSEGENAGHPPKPKEMRLEAIKEFIASNPGSTRSQVQEAISEDGRFSASDSTVQRDLNQLVEGGELDPGGSGVRNDPYRYHPISKTHFTPAESPACR